MKLSNIIAITLLVFSCSKRNIQKEIEIADNKPVIAKIVKISGNVKLNNLPAKLNDDVVKLSNITTVGYGYAIVEFKNIGKLAVGSNTIITIMSLSHYSVEIDQPQGNTFTKIDKLNLVRFTVSTPTIIALATGTTFEIDVTPKFSTIKLLEGKLLLAKRYNFIGQSDLIFLEDKQKTDIIPNGYNKQINLNNNEIAALFGRVKEVE